MMNSKLRNERIIRVIADFFLINTALLLALVSYYIWVITYYQDLDRAQKLSLQFLSSHWLHGGLLTAICLTLFAASGFYSYGRFYRGRYKAVLILQTVTITFLFFNFLTFFIHSLDTLPRSLLGLEWFFTLAVVGGARLWSTIWKQLVRQEKAVLGKEIANDNIRNVLLIGGAGYIGSALIDRMLASGYYVRLLDKLIYGEDAIADFRNHPKFELINSDFREIHKVVEAMDGMDAVIHLGAIVGDPACALDEALTIEINLMATKMIAEVAKANRINRFIFASTCSVYGASDDVLDENSALNPVSLYAKSKIASEQVLQKMANENFAPIYVRFGTIYGLSHRTRFDLVINLLSAKALVDGQITVFGGDQWRPFVHVQDAAHAVFKILEAPLDLVNREVFNVGSDDQNYTIEDIGKLVGNAVPTAELILSDADGDKRNYRVSFQKIARVLNFKPEWTVEKGIQQVLNSFAVGDVVDYQDARYNNAKFLSEAGAYQLDKEHNWAEEILDDITNNVTRQH
jgi:nucleoside-diphosphate-sugar epimerase